jgi:hypothetical protein
MKQNDLFRAWRQSHMPLLEQQDILRIIEKTELQSASESEQEKPKQNFFSGSAKLFICSVLLLMGGITMWYSSLKQDGEAPGEAKYQSALQQNDIEYSSENTLPINSLSAEKKGDIKRTVRPEKHFYTAVNQTLMQHIEKKNKDIPVYEYLCLNEKEMELLGIDKSIKDILFQNSLCAIPAALREYRMQYPESLHPMLISHIRAITDINGYGPAIELYADSTDRANELHRIDSLNVQKDITLIAIGIHDKQRNSVSLLWFSLSPSLVQLLPMRYKLPLMALHVQPECSGEIPDALAIMGCRYTNICSAAAGALISCRTFPQPVQQELFVDIESAAPRQITIRILDLSGRDIILPVKNLQADTGHNTQAIQLPVLPDGMYMVEISSDQNEKIFSMIIVR